MNTISRFFLWLANIFASNVRIPTATIKRFIDEADTDNDGNLSLKEMIAAIRSMIGAYLK